MQVFVGNIPLDAKEGELRDLFQRCGTVKNIAMAKDKKTNKFKYGCKSVSHLGALEAWLSALDLITGIFCTSGA
jgi:hypothetical protein